MLGKELGGAVVVVFGVDSLCAGRYPVVVRGCRLIGGGSESEKAAQ
jgi:hypothetical protein